MKSIKDFLNTAVKTNELPFIYGGKEKPTTLLGENCPDTWYDNDDDGEYSPGDTICYHKCADE